MPDPIIVVEHLSKLYELGTIGTKTLQESLERRWYRVRGKEHLLQKVGAKRRMIGPDHPQAGPRPNTVWALKDVSFSVKRGEVLGIVGANGAGKSTLLKILTRITEPTSGRAVIYGRVASLLEVGTGFNPELTGRDNVYLSGAIRGMKRAEIDHRFDEIVAFSEIGSYLDTPVKRYSSGMYVRLAFAVAAHLEPEILLVDEVLAVGDAAFQAKCLGKMGEVAGHGRTVLFVSHNMGSVLALCGQAMVLHEGSVRFAGPADRAVDQYLSSVARHSFVPDLERNRETGLAGYTGISFGGLGYVGKHTAVSGRPLDIRLTYRAKQCGLKLHFTIAVCSLAGERLLHLSTRQTESEYVESARTGEVVCHFDKLPLPEGAYRINLSLHLADERVDRIVDAARLDVLQGDFYGTGRSSQLSQSKVLVEQVWTHSSQETGASPATSLVRGQSQVEA
jgi:lipopolysaccharide transport system ATP-binding protein